MLPAASWLGDCDTPESGGHSAAANGHHPDLPACAQALCPFPSDQQEART